MSDDLWFKDAIVYELHVRAFNDSNADGIGDFRGLTQKLDYLQDLGVTAIWLLPFYPSPLRDDGYDIADYTAIHSDYGTMRQFRRFVDEAHRRGLKVITELAINHTSDQHPWFQRAVRAPAGSPERDFYVWSDTADPYPDARIIFPDFEQSNWAWHPDAEQYYWHRFYSHQPDLNFDNPAVHRAVKEVLDRWIGMGVDGMRLDAIPYLYEREGTNCENLPETHDYLRQLRAHLDATWPGRMFLAEANMWPEDAAAYFGDGDECHMNFHFPLMPRLFMAVRMEDRFPVIDILQQTPAIPDNCQWAVFLRNHDELTLEMVTDEERDYMRRVYARDPRMRINLGIRRRLAPLLDNSRRLIELLNGLLFSLPGTPVLYYGDEIGMGDNVYLGDRNGVRTPMQWSPDRNAGFSQANPQSLYLPVIIDPEYHYETVNVEAQRNNPASLWWWMKRLIALRRQHPVFGRGDIEFLYPDNPRVLAFVRHHEDDQVLVVANLSRYPQAVELDLSAFEGLSPIELFGHTPFPPIGRLPYFLTLGPHDFYWFGLAHAREEIRAFPGHVSRPPAEEEPLPTVTTTVSWPRLASTEAGTALARQLPQVLAGRRWFGGKDRTIRRTAITDAVTVPTNGDACQVLLATVEYAQGDPELYVLPVGFAPVPHDETVERDLPEATLARIEGKGDAPSGVLLDASWNRELADRLLDVIRRGRRIKGRHGVLAGSRSGGSRVATDVGEGVVLSAEQSNTSIRYGDRYVLKVVRRPDEGENPDLEVSRFLGRVGFAHVPRYVGSLTYEPDRGAARTIGVLQEFVPNEGDAWTQAFEVLRRFFEQALSDLEEAGSWPRPRGTLLSRAAREVPDDVYARIGPYVETAQLLGERTGQLHVALAADPDDPAFAPEEITGLYLRSVYQSMRTRVRRTMQDVRRSLDGLPGALRDDAQRLADAEEGLLGSLEWLKTATLTGALTRTHGDYHLGQVLWTGRDFVIIDFEGEPAAPLGERRLKRSPVRDVAGMLRSFRYASQAALLELHERGSLASDEQAQGAAVAADDWAAWVSSAFLRGYLSTARDGAFLPETDDELEPLLRAYLVEKTLYELSYELGNRPTWVQIPLHDALALLDEAG